MALVFPILLSFFVSLLYLGFYVHDRFVMEEIAYEAALYGVSCGAGMTDSVQLAEEKCQMLLENTFFCLQKVEFQAEKKGNRLCVSINGEFQIPVFRNLIKIFLEGYPHIKVCAESVEITPLTIIRLKDAIYE